MKRLTAVLLVCISVFLLTACSGATDPSKDTVSDAAGTMTGEITETRENETTDTQTDEITSDDYFDNTRIDVVPADTSKVADLTLLDDGYDVYQLPGSGNGGWRYGPS